MLKKKTSCSIFYSLFTNFLITYDKYIYLQTKWQYVFRKGSEAISQILEENVYIFYFPLNAHMENLL